MSEILCKDVFGKDICWDPSGFDAEGLCGKCKFVKGECPNKYIKKDDGSALYCQFSDKRRKQ